MKHTQLLLSCIAIFLFSVQPLRAQLEDGSIAPDWTLADIYGNTHTLYDYLDQGKTVILDFSATWCGPCWNYHLTGALEDFYYDHGPDGTDESMVFMIEGDITTDMDDLLGLTQESQGDWVSTTPYPIIDLQTNDLMIAYDIGYYPTIYKICQDRKIYEVGQMPEQILTTWIESCTLAGELSSTNGTTCYGFGEGSAYIDVSGGYGSVNFHWSNGVTTEDLESVEAGSYAVTVTEGNGRQIFIDDIEIPGPTDPIEVTSYTVTDLLCFGDGTGQIQVQVQGGNGGFSYFWSNGGSGPLIQSLSAGQYTVTIEDSQSCEHVESYDVDEPDLLDFSFSWESDHCGQAQGTIVVSPVGGTLPYTLESSGGLVVQYNVLGLGEGDYVVELFDAHDCQVSMEVSIEDVPGPEIVMPESPTVTCADGPAILSPAIINWGGGDLEYTWSTPDGDILSGEYDPECTVYAPGIYTLHIEDLDFGCDIQESLEVFGSVELPVIFMGSDLTMTCSNPHVQPDVTLESIGDFVFEWTTLNGHILSGGATLTPVFDAPGTYHLLVVNAASGCMVSDDLVVIDDRVFPDANFAITSEELTAAFTAAQSGAMAYHWDFGDGQTSDMQNTQHEYGITGTYHVCLTVTNACGDATSCEDIWIESSTAAIQVELAISNVSCFGVQDGALSVVATGGSGNFEFHWLGPDGGTLEGADLTGLGPGLYVLTVSDDQGNEVQVQASIFEPTELVVDIKILPPGLNGPGIDLTVDGGTLGYSYLWSNGATTQDLIFLRTGTYQCTVTDANGCEYVTDPIRIINPRDKTIRPDGYQVEVVGDPSNQPLIIIVDSDNNVTHTVRVFDTLGQPLNVENWTGREHEIDLRSYPSGVYFIAVYEQQEILRTVRLTIWH